MSEKVITKVGYYGEDDTPEDVFDLYSDFVVNIPELTPIRDAMNRNESILKSDKIEAVANPEKLAIAQQLAKKISECVCVGSCRIDSKTGNPLVPKRLFMSITSDRFFCKDPKRLISYIDDLAVGTFSIYNDNGKVGIDVSVNDVINYREGK